MTPAKHVLLQLDVLLIYKRVYIETDVNFPSIPPSSLEVIYPPTYTWINLHDAWLTD